MKYFSLLLLFLVSSVASAYTLGPTNPGKWGDPTLGTGATISYSFMADDVNCETSKCSALSSFMPAGFKSEIERAFAAWASVADLTFFEVTDDGADFNAPTTSGDIRFAGHEFDGPGNTLAHGYYPPANGRSLAGDIHFDSEENWTLAPSTNNFSIFWVALHEIGHALGLGHSSFANTIMYPFYNASVTELQADDIAGIRALYGMKAIPVPAAGWLFASAILGFIVSRRKLTKTA